MAGSRIAVEITANASELQASVAKAAASLRDLAKVVSTTSAESVKTGAAVIKSNDAAAASYGKLGTASEAAAVKSTAAAAKVRTGWGAAHSEITKMGRDALLALTALSGGALYEAASFQHATTAIAAHAGISVKAAQDIGKAFLSTAGHSVFSAKELADAFGNVAGQLKATEGRALTAKQSLDYMKTSTDLAVASGEDLNTTTGALSNVMQVYHLRLGEAAKTSDILFNVSKTLHIPIEQIATTVDRLKGRLGDLAPSLRDVSGLMLSLAQHGIQGSRGALIASSALQTLIGNSKKTDDVLKALGLSAGSLYGANGKFIGIANAIALLEPRLASLTEKNRNFALAALFGKGAAQVLGQVVAEGAQKFDAASAAASRSGTAQQAARQHAHDLEEQWRTLIATLQDWAVKIGGVLVPAFTSLVKWITSATDWLGKHKAAAEALATVIGTVLSLAITSFVVSKMKLFIGAIKDGFLALRSIVTVAPEVEGATVAMGAGFKSMLGPIGLVIAAITTLNALYSNNKVPNVPANVQTDAEFKKWQAALGIPGVVQDKELALWQKAGRPTGVGSGSILTSGNVPPDPTAGVSGNNFIGAQGVSKGSSPLMRKTVGFANAINAHHYNYEWGGGHNASFAPSHGTGHGSGVGTGYDCSGVISAILHNDGLLDSPLTAAGFMGYGLAGPGGANSITIYASPTHVFAKVGGEYFGTSSANPGGGAGWFTSADTNGFTVRHVDLGGGAAGSTSTSTFTGGNAAIGALIAGGGSSKSAASRKVAAVKIPTGLLGSSVYQLGDPYKNNASSIDAMEGAIRAAQAKKVNAASAGGQSFLGQLLDAMSNGSLSSLNTILNPSNSRTEDKVVAALNATHKAALESLALKIQGLYFRALGQQNLLVAKAAYVAFVKGFQGTASRLTTASSSMGTLFGAGSALGLPGQDILSSTNAQENPLTGGLNASNGLSPVLAGLIPALEAGPLSQTQAAGYATQFKGGALGSLFGGLASGKLNATDTASTYQAIYNLIGTLGSLQSSLAANTTAVVDNTSTMVSLLQQQNTILSERLALNTAQTTVLRNFIPQIPHFAAGGPVLKDGLIYAHAGERVLSAGQTQQVNNSMSPEVHNHFHIEGSIAPLIKTIRTEIAHPDNVRTVSSMIGQRTTQLQGAPGGFRGYGR